jgi:hypothetical protein
MSVENSTLSIKKSRRDDISVENSTLSIKKSRRDDMLGDGARTVSTTANNHINQTNHSSDIQFIIHNS